MKAVLSRAFYAPDGRLYKRANNAGELLVHNFPDHWTLPSGTVPAEEALKTAALPAADPEPETLSQLSKAKPAKG
jgi:ADP-ribose pyrophosphatase YjhB (NUDIX family)